MSSAGDSRTAAGPVASGDRSGTRLSYLAGALGAGFAGQALVLVTGILAARLLGPSDRGHLALLWTVTFAVAQLGTFGLPLGATYEIARGAATAGSFLRAFRAVLTGTAVAATAISTVLLFVIGLASGTSTAAILVAIPALPLAVVFTFGIALLQGSGRFHAMQILQVLPAAAYAALLGALAVATTLTLPLVVASWTASYAVGAVVVAAAVARTISADRRQARKPSPIDRERTIRFGLRGLLGSVSPTETFRIDQLLVGLVLSPRSLGIYVAALAFTNLPRFVTQGIGFVAYPAVAALETHTERFRAVARFTVIGSAIGVASGLILAIVAEPLVRVTFGPAFGDAVPALRVLLIAAALLATRRVLSDALRGAGMSGAGSKAEVASWIALLPAVPLGATSFGLVGVAWALCIGYAASLAYLLMVARGGARDAPLESSRAQGTTDHQRDGPRTAAITSEFPNHGRETPTDDAEARPDAARANASAPGAARAADHDPRPVVRTNRWAPPAPPAHVEPRGTHDMPRRTPSAGSGRWSPPTDTAGDARSEGDRSDVAAPLTTGTVRRPAGGTSKHHTDRPGDVDNPWVP